jgi:hypothetical protein
VTTLVLASSMREANAWGEAHGVRVRHATNASLVTGYFSDIVELRSWNTYRTRHGVNAAVRSYLRKTLRKVEYRVDREWDYEAYQAQKAADVLAKAGRAVAGDPAARREILVDAANQAVEALAKDLGISVGHLLAEALNPTTLEELAGVAGPFGDDRAKLLELAADREAGLLPPAPVHADKPQVVVAKEADPNVEPAPAPGPFAGKPVPKAVMDLAEAKELGDPGTDELNEASKPKPAPRKPAVKRATPEGKARREAAGKVPPVVNRPTEVEF